MKTFFLSLALLISAPALAFPTITLNCGKLTKQDGSSLSDKDISLEMRDYKEYPYPKNLIGGERYTVFNGLYIEKSPDGKLNVIQMFQDLPYVNGRADFSLTKVNPRTGYYATISDYSVVMHEKDNVFTATVLYDAPKDYDNSRSASADCVQTD